jgi:hypothetical protein
MTRLDCTARRIGDYESRTEEYELAFSVGPTSPRRLRIKYQAARAYEINAALDAAVETAREAIGDDVPNQRGRHSDGQIRRGGTQNLRPGILKSTLRPEGPERATWLRSVPLA